MLCENTAKPINIVNVKVCRFVLIFECLYVCYSIYVRMNVDRLQPWLMYGLHFIPENAQFPWDVKKSIITAMAIAINRDSGRLF